MPPTKSPPGKSPQATAALCPIGVEQQSLVIAETRKYIDLAGRLFGRNFAAIPVYFDLSGRASGMYKVKGGQRWIRYNPYIFALHFDEHLDSTVAHEVGHYVADSLYGWARIKPHGVEWRDIMARLDADASRTFAHSLNGVPQRQHRKITYHCPCGEHQLGIRRHNKVSGGQAAYKCRRCHSELRLSDTRLLNKSTVSEKGRAPGKS